MPPNYGKEFEGVVRKAFEKVPNVSIDRLHDQTTGFKGSSNICDFIVYREPYEYYFECKSVHGNTLPFSNITDKQWQGMLEKSQIEGVTAGVICWWIDKDVTKFIPIQVLAWLDMSGYKSIRYDKGTPDKYIGDITEIKGKKKRVFFDYSMQDFLDNLNKSK